MSRFSALTRADGPSIGLVSAPTGFGKTTLLTDAVDAQVSHHPIAWAALDEGDNSPGGFWSTVVAAMAVSDPAAGQVFRPLFSHAAFADDRFPNVLCEAAESLPSELLLVLDDLHHLTDPALLGQIALFVRRRPPSLRLIMSSRHDPTVPLHAERIAGEVIEVRAHDLALTVEELAETLADDELPVEDIEAINSLTEGWPAGVQLARAVVRQAGDAARLAVLFGNQSGALSDYLFHEAFTAQTEQSQRVLLCAAAVTDVTDDLAVRLTGIPDAGAVLTEVAERTGLITRHAGRTADRDTHYRFHPLLRTYLVGRYSQQDRPGLLEARRVAVQWFREHDLPWETLTAAIGSEGPELVDDVLRAHGVRLLLRGETDAVRRLLAAAPVQTGWTTSMCAVAAGIVGDGPGAQSHLTLAQDRIDPDDLALAQLRWTARALIAETNAYAGYIPEPMPGGGALRDDHLGLLLRLHRGHSQVWFERQADMLPNLGELRRLSEALGEPCVLPEVLLLDTAEAACRADYQAVAKFGQEVLDAAAAERPLHSSTVSRALHMLAWSAFQRLDDDACRGFVAQARDQIPQAGEPFVDLAATTIEAILAAQPMDAEACDALQRRWEDHAGPRPTAFVATSAFPRARRAWAAGRSDVLQRIVVSTQKAVGDTGDVATLRAFILAIQGRPASAARLVAPVCEGTLPCLSPVARTEALLLQAALYADAGRDYQAFSALAQGLDLVQETGALRAVAEAGSTLHQLISANFDRLAGYEVDLAAALGYASPLAEVDELVEPLTARELDVLRELTTLDSVEEIASHLLISTNTVKTHIRAIYRKLGVSTRREGVTEARRRGLL